MRSEENLSRRGQILTLFRDRRLPEPAALAGYAALIEQYALPGPLPETLCGIGQRHRVHKGDGWHLLTPRHAPEPTLAGQLKFALKREGLDLALLKQLFAVVARSEIEALVVSEPTGSYARRIWFLYEWLSGRRLDLPDATAGNYVDVIDARLQFARAPGELSPRHRARNNLPGTPRFCPLVFRSVEFDEAVTVALRERAEAAVGRVASDVLARAAAFLLLQDSRSSYAIEGERPPRNRLERWGRAIGQAGQHPLDVDELLRLQRIVIGDARFVELGLRTEGGFVGEHDRDSGRPLPIHISARSEDLSGILDGLIAFDRRTREGFDPIAAAAAIAFGFVCAHPFVDGNGRVHRYLIHHALAQRGFVPSGAIFPVSAAILRHIDAYRAVLEGYSQPLLEQIAWEPTEKGNVRVLDDTADYYRFFDATPHALLLLRCIRETIEQDLPQEVTFLQAYDRFAQRVQQIVDMPQATLDLLFRFLRQNDGRLSKRARTRELSLLSEGEIARVEQIFADELQS